MTKVVINSCFGGFSLSEEGVLHYARLKRIQVWHEKGIFDTTVYWTVPPEKRPPSQENFLSWTMEERKESNRLHNEAKIYDRDIDRDDPYLVQTVEDLGEKANGKFAELRVVEIPDGVEWQIEEYDGNEWVSEVHRTWS